MQGCESVGLEVERFVYSLQAVANACLDGGSRSNGACVVMDLGGRSSELGLFEGGRLTAALTVPWGLHALVQEIAATCRLTPEQALAMCVEGLSSLKPAVRELAERHLQHLREGLSRLLSGRSLPKAAIVTGRGALVDGVVEWVEAATQVHATLGRSPRASRCLPVTRLAGQAGGELSRQVALTPALGVIELVWAAQAGADFSVASQDLSLLGRAKSLLTEYF